MERFRAELRVQKARHTRKAALAEHLLRFRDRAENMIERRRRNGVDQRFAVAVELVGSIMVLFDWKGWFGAGMLGVFTVLAAAIANDFWTMTGHDRFMATNAFFEHLGLAGAFVMAAMISRWHARN